MEVQQVSSDKESEAETKEEEHGSENELAVAS
jgi:hypothetical protein